MKRSRARCLLIAMVVLGGVSAGVAHAGPRTMSGSYDVTAFPGAPLYRVGNAACGSSVEGVTKNTHAITVPFSGWLRVDATDLTGDWDLALADSSGRGLAWGGMQEMGLAGDREGLDYYVAARQRVAIVLCNFAAATTAHVTYRLMEGPAWARASTVRRSAVEELTYISPAIGTHSRSELCYVGFEVGCTAHQPPSFARFVTVKVDDDVAPNVAAMLYEDAGTTSYRRRPFCTAIDKPVAITPRTDWLGVTLVNGPCADGTPAQATRGTVTLRYSSHR